MEECGQIVWNDFYQFGVGKPCSTTYFLEVGARVSFKLATKGFPIGKKLWKCSFSDCFSKRKTEECQQKHLSNIDQFSITTIFCSGLAESCNFIKNKPLAQVFSCEFCEISKNTFFAEHLLATTSVLSKTNKKCYFYVLNVCT